MNVGDTFGAWTVVGNGQWGSGAKYLVFEHECGNQRKVEPYRAGKAMQACKKCEARAAYRKDAGHIILHKEFRNYKHSAKKRGYAFELEFPDFVTLMLGFCAYCGREPYVEKYVTEARRSVWHEGQTIKLHGIDRVDNTQGYVKGNVVTCCTICNFAKRDMTLDAWKEMVTMWAANLDSLKYAAKFG